MDPLRFLTTRDSGRRMIMHAIAREAAEMRKIENNNLAVKIAENVGKMFKKS